MKTIVVVGGVAGGMSFATRYRRLNENDRIIVLDKGPYVSFANCGLPYYVSGDIAERSSLIVAQQSMLEERFKLDIRTEHEVVEVNSESKFVRVVDGTGKESEISYDTLVLSPGANPFVPEVGGITHTVRNIPDVDRIMENVNVKSALVIGAGFIGLEMVESLRHRGLDVTLVELAPEVLAPFDSEMAIMARHELERNGVTIYTGDSVKSISDTHAVLTSGVSVPAELVIMSIGVSPATEFLAGSGVELGLKGGILVGESYQTSVEDIYAVGDAIVVKNQISGDDALISLASPANRQGRQLADNLAGIKNLNKGSLGTAIVRIFDLTFASTGMNERMLQGRDIQIIHLIGKNHAGYFPGSEEIHMKVIYDTNTHLILGAQAVGKDGVDKRIDVIATAIKAGMSVDSLQELELTYAPPYGSAKDLVNMVGYASQNLILGISETIQWHQVRDAVNEGAVLVDVRTVQERAKGYIEGSIGIPLDSLRDSLHLLDINKEIIVHCQSSVRSYNAERILRQLGYKVRNLDGSFALYSRILPKEIIKNV